VAEASPIRKRRLHQGRKTQSSALSAMRGCCTVGQAGGSITSQTPVLAFAPVHLTPTSTSSLFLPPRLCCQTQIRNPPAAFPETVCCSALPTLSLVVGSCTITPPDPREKLAVNSCSCLSTRYIPKNKFFALAGSVASRPRASSPTPPHVSRWPAAVRHQARATMSSS
jgi:hypothetical protein